MTLRSKARWEKKPQVYYLDYITVDKAQYFLRKMHCIFFSAHKETKNAFYFSKAVVNFNV